MTLEFRAQGWGLWRSKLRQSASVVLARGTAGGDASNQESFCLFFYYEVVYQYACLAVYVKASQGQCISTVCDIKPTVSLFSVELTSLPRGCKTAQSVQTVGNCSQCTFHLRSQFLIQNNFTPSVRPDSAWHTNTTVQCFQLIGYTVVGKRTGDRFHLCIIPTISSTYHRVSTCECAQNT